MGLEGYVRILFIMLLSVLLSACSPDYNWRSITLGAGEVTAFFPGKPSVQQRELVFEGQPLNFSVTSVTVSGAIFAVGYALLPQAVRNDPKLRSELTDATIRSVYQNLGQSAPDQLPAVGVSFQAHGQVAAEGMRTRATVWLTEDALVQGLVSAADEGFPAAQADEFFRGLALPAR